MIKKGDKAPDFKAQALVNGVEEQISLADFKGKRVALYFYPKDMTPGCTIQAENLRDNFDFLVDSNIVVIGVSKDPIKSHEKFYHKKKLQFILVSDEDLKVNNAYGVWQKKKFMGREFMGTVRTTFLIDENQKVVNVIEKPKVTDHANEIVKEFGLE